MGPVKKGKKTSSSIGSNQSNKQANKEVKIIVSGQQKQGIKISKPTFNVQINNNVTNNNNGGKPHQMINPVQFVQALSAAAQLTQNMAA